MPRDILKNIGDINNILVLTGAGFTKNFGGFLAREVWSKIFNNPRVQESEKIRQLLQETYDYESAYSQVITSEKFTIEEKDIMRIATQGAYKALDDIVRTWVFTRDNPYPVNIYGLGDLFSRIYTSARDKKTFFFTLNQDLFMERRWGYFTPGVRRFPAEFYNAHGRELREEEFVPLPKENVAEEVFKGIASHNGIHYIKLHGSYGWKSSDGSNKLVIGTEKEELIQGEPVFSLYFDIFRACLFSGGRKLLIIGYGFKDKHINLALLEGVKSHKLQIHIVSPQDPEELRYQIEHGHYYAREILSGLSGYYPLPLVEIFPGNQASTIHATEIRKALLS